MFGSFAYAANPSPDLPQVSIVEDEESAEPDPAEIKQMKGNSKDAALDDFYGRKKAKGKGGKALKGKSAHAKAKSGADATSENVYGDVPLPPTTKDDEYGGQVAMPEVVQKAIMSRSDVNRVICPEPIKDVIYSEEKGVMSKFYGNSAYIKFNFEQVGEDPVYSKNPVELHIICGDTTYSLVAVPMPIPPQVIRLGNNRVAKARENASIFKDDDTSKKIRELMKRALKEEFPESFDVKKSAIPIRIFRDIDVLLTRTTVIDGEGMTVKEFTVTSKVDGLELKEKQFLRKELSANPAAIAIEPGKQKPFKGEPVRVFIVEFKMALTPEGAANVD